MAKKIRIGYIRVSTDTEEQLSALQNQRGRIAAAGVCRIVEDVESGLSNCRSGFNELLHLIDTKKVDEVVCTRIDRLGRDASATDAFLAVAAKRGVAITCLDGGTVDSLTPKGFLMSRIATSMAEVESRMISMRIKAGYEQGRKLNKPLRGQIAWGYQLKEDKSALIPHPVEFHRAKLFIEVLKKCSWRMTKALEQWKQTEQGPIPLSCLSAVRQWLLNPILRGGIGYHRKRDLTYTSVVWNTHQALLSQSDYSLFEHQRMINKLSWGGASTHPPRLLTGLCVCAECGKRMSIVGAHGSGKDRIMCKQTICNSRYKTTHDTDVVEAIAAALCSRAAQLADYVVEENPQAEVIRAEIAKLRAMNDDDLAPAIKAKEQRLEAELQTGTAPDPELLKAFADPAVWTQLDQQELRELYLHLVERVVIERKVVVNVVLRL